VTTLIKMVNARNASYANVAGHQRRT